MMKGKLTILLMISMNDASQFFYDGTCLFKYYRIVGKLFADIDDKH